jgi:hypothetical protein
MQSICKLFKPLELGDGLHHIQISSLRHESWIISNRIFDKDPCSQGHIDKMYYAPSIKPAHPSIKASLNRLVIWDEDSLTHPTSQSLLWITICLTCQSRQGRVQPFWGTASPWKLVEDARIDLGLVISVVRWATLHVIVHATRAVVEEASRAKDSIMDLEDEVIFRVVEGLEKDVVEEGVTTSSPEEISSLHQGQTCYGL